MLQGCGGSGFSPLATAALTTMFSPLSQTDPRAVAVMLHEGRGLDYEVHVEVESFQRRGEEVRCSMSSSLNVLDDVHFTDITYVVFLHAGERVTVYDRNLQMHFPSGAFDVVTEAWKQVEDTGMPQCWNLQEVRSAAWVGSYFRCPRCATRQRGGVAWCVTADWDDLRGRGPLCGGKLGKEFPPWGCGATQRSVVLGAVAVE